VLDVASLVAGAVLLYFGAEWLVAGAAGLASSLGVRPLIVGLTVVAYGTSAPELVVSMSAGLSGQSGIALGNVVGSNIANLALILGAAALIRPARVDPTLIRRELPVLVATTAVLPLALINGVVGRPEGAALLAVALGYSVWMIRSSGVGSAGEASAVAEAAAIAGGVVDADAPAAAVVSRARLALRAVAGLALLVGGGYLLVEGAVGVARSLGMSERVIGLTIVAIGTSLPELATSLVAASRGHADIAVGNVIGSNIFNVLLILGATAVVAPIPAALSSVTLDLAMLGGITGFAVVVMATRRRVTRVEATVMLLSYVAFLIALVAA
jgi:cation:H+ antiporter